MSWKIQYRDDDDWNDSNIVFESQEDAKQYLKITNTDPKMKVSLRAMICDEWPNHRMVNGEMRGWKKPKTKFPI